MNNIDVRQIQQPEITLYVRSSLNKNMMDLRLGRSGMTFGILRDVARQYGIQCKELNDCIEFKAPKPRMRIFIEKLHFSRTPYVVKKAN